MTDKTEAQEDLEILPELRDKNPEDLTSGVLADELRGKTPEELQAFVEVLDAHLRSIHQTDEGELRDKNPEESKAFDYGLKLRDQAMARLEEHRAISEVFRRRPKAVVQAMSRVKFGDEGMSDVRRLTNGEARDRALRTLDSRDATAHMSDAQKTQVERSLRRDTDIARRIIVTENEDYREAWMKLLTNPNGHMLLSDDERDAVRAWEEYRAMSGSADASGGYGVPVFIDPSIILTAQESGNPFLQICRQVNVTTDAWKGVSSAGVTWSFDAESATTANPVSDDSPTLAQPQVDVHTARGFIPYSIQVGEDYPGFADEMSRLLAEGYDELLVEKFSNGSGTGEPRGILTALDANTNVEVNVSTTNAFAVADIYKVWKALPQKYRRNASWMSSVDVNNKVRSFGGTNVYHGYTVDLTAEAADILLNKQWYESPYFPDYVEGTGSTTTVSNILVVGDFRNYLIARRSGMTVELVPHLFQQQTANAGFGRPTGQRGWFGYARIGGNTVNDLGFRLLQDPAG